MVIITGRMLNYADIQRVYRTEKNTPLLQKIEGNFYSELSKLISGVGDEHKEHLLKLADDIYDRRKNKIIMQAMRTENEPPMNAIPLEKEMYTEITHVLTEYKQGLSNQFRGIGAAAGKVEKQQRPADKPIGLEETNAETELTADEKISVRIIRPLPSFIGSDMVHYGPVNDGDILKLPTDNARILTERGIAEEI